MKRARSNPWEGPGAVIGRENKQIVVQYGETYLTLHACSLQHTNQSKLISNSETKNILGETNDINDQSTSNNKPVTALTMTLLKYLTTAVIVLVVLKLRDRK